MSMFSLHEGLMVYFGVSKSTDLTKHCLCFVGTDRLKNGKHALRDQLCLTGSQTAHHSNNKASYYTTTNEPTFTINHILH